MSGERRVQTVREFMESSVEDHIRELASSINGLKKGQSNNYWLVDLETGAETTFALEYARIGSLAIVSPTNTRGADVISNGFTWAEVQNGRIVIHHDSDDDPSAGARSVGVLLVG
jgi:hypothetical protein